VDILFKVDLDVVSFSLIDRRNFWHGVVFLLMKSRKLFAGRLNNWLDTVFFPSTIATKL
jgi:hypothetical protein